MIPSTSSLFKLALVMLKLPLYLAYGLYRLLSGALRLPGRIQATRRLLQEALPCPCCGELNSLTGRWVCGTCGGTYLGFVGACTLCGASCFFFPCASCQGSIVVERR